MNKAGIVVGLGLAAALSSCCVGGVFAKLRSDTMRWKFDVMMAPRRKEPPPPEPLYAFVGDKNYKRLAFLCFGVSGVVLLAAAGAAGFMVLTAPPPPKLEGAVRFRRSPAMECVFFVPLLMGAGALVMAAASKNLGMFLVGAATVPICLAGLALMHWVTAQVADAEGIVFGFGRRYRWADLESSGYTNVKQRTESGGKRSIGGYYTLKFKTGKVDLAPARYLNWDECWEAIAAKTGRSPE